MAAGMIAGKTKLATTLQPPPQIPPFTFEPERPREVLSGRVISGQQSADVTPPARRCPDTVLRMPAGEIDYASQQVPIAPIRHQKWQRRSLIVQAKCGTLFAVLAVLER